VDSEEQRELRTKELQKIYGKPETIENVSIEDMKLTANPQAFEIGDDEIVLEQPKLTRVS